MAGTSAPDGRRQNPEAGNGLGTKRVEKEERKTKKKLERHNHEEPQGWRTDVGGGCRSRTRQTGMEELYRPMCTQHEEGLRSKVSSNNKIFIKKCYQCTNRFSALHFLMITILRHILPL